MRAHTPASTAERVLLGILLVASFFLYVWGTWDYAFWDPWEPKYAQAVRDMRARDDLVTPFLDGRIRWTKPILIYWTMAASTAVFGENEFATRLPSGLAGVLGVFVLYHCISRLRGRRTGLIAAGVMGTLPQYFFLARQAVPDMMLTVFLGCAMGFLAVARFGQQQTRRYFGLFYASVALAFLTKGPVACVITLGSVLTFWLIDADPSRLRSPSTVWSDFRQMLTRYHVGLGLLLFVLITSPWYGAMLIKHGWAFIDNFIVDENLKRFGQSLWGHDGVVTYYIEGMFHGFFPWFSLVPLGVIFCFPGRERLDEEARQRWYYLSWFIFVFVLFTVANTKLGHYIFPIAPATAVLVALVWEAYLSKASPYWIRTVLLLSCAIAYLPFKDFLDEGLGHIMNNFTPYREITIGEDQVRLFLQIFFAAWVGLVALGFFVRRSAVLVGLTLALTFANGVYFTQFVMPVHTDERTLKSYADRYLEIREDDAELVFFGWVRYSLNYYLGHDGYTYFTPHEANELVRHVRGKEHVYIVAQTLFEEGLLDRLHAATRTRWSLLADEHPEFELIGNSRGKQFSPQEDAPPPEPADPPPG